MAHLQANRHCEVTSGSGVGSLSHGSYVQPNSRLGLQGAKQESIYDVRDSGANGDRERAIWLAVLSYSQYNGRAGWRILHYCENVAHRMGALHQERGCRVYLNRKRSLHLDRELTSGKCPQAQINGGSIGSSKYAAVPSTIRKEDLGGGNPNILNRYRISITSTRRTSEEISGEWHDEGFLHE